MENHYSFEMMSWFLTLALLVPLAAKLIFVTANGISLQSLSGMTKYSFLWTESLLQWVKNLIAPT